MNQWDLEDDHDYDEEGEDSDREYHVEQLQKSTTPRRKTRMGGSSDARKGDHNNKRYPKNLASSAEVYSDYDDDLDVEILPPSTHGRDNRNVDEISIDELREAFDDVAARKQGAGGVVDKM